MRQPMWDAIDGETLLTSLAELAATLPRAARVRFAGVEIVVADYALWKRLVRARQSDGTETDNV